MAQKLIFVGILLLIVLAGVSAKAEKNTISYFTDAKMEALFESNDLDLLFGGKVTGIIREAGTNVVIVGTLNGSATDEDGRFTINNVENGPRVLQVSYLGYKTLEIEIEITDGQTLNIEVAMEFEGVEGEEVVVTSQVRGQVAAINQQLSSNTISNIVAKDKIQELPDVNAAESIGRLPGVSIQRSGGEATKADYITALEELAGIPPVFDVTTTVQAEDGSLSGNAEIDTFEGFSYFQMDGGGFLEWKFNLETGGQYDLGVWTHMRGNDQRGQHHYINGVEITDIDHNWGELAYDSKAGITAGMPINDWVWVT